MKNTNFNIIKNFENNFDYSKINLISNANKSLNKIQVPKNTKLRLIELFDKQNEDKLFRNIILEKNSYLEYVKINKNTSDLEISYDIKTNEDSQIVIHFFELSDFNMKNILSCDLENKNIDIKINALVKLKNDASNFNSFNISHKHPYSFSDIKIRHLLDDKTKAEFEALSIIENEALFSKAFQDCKTILLSDDASIKARPHLEILTDELEASHGATSGGLDKEALYYLRTRGLDEKTAYSMLLEAFYKNSIENIQDESLRDFVKKEI